MGGSDSVPKQNPSVWVGKLEYMDGCSNLWVYGTWRTLACLRARDRPRGSNGSLISVGSWLMGMTTGVRRIITSVSRRFLMLDSQFVESRTTTARGFSRLPRLEGAAAEVTPPVSTSLAQGGMLGLILRELVYRNSLHSILVCSCRLLLRLLRRHTYLPMPIQTKRAHTTFSEHEKARRRKQWANK